MAEVAGEEGKDGQSRRRSRLSHPVLVTLGAVAGLVAILGGAGYYAYARSHVSPDDAFIDADIVQVSPQVAGPVTGVYVTDNQEVRRGDLLLATDPRDYEARLAQARANLAGAIAGHQGSQIAVGLTRGTSTATVAQARSALEAAEIQVIAARSRLAQAQAQVDTALASADQARADIAQAEAAVRQAELNLSYTKIYAPVSGHVTEKAVAVGDYVEPGQDLMAIVPKTLYVTANFKETDLADIRPGEAADIYVDAYPHLALKGHVDSIMRGSGARFSLLPPENATGDYVKVVQRVPVKIVFDQPPDPSHPLGPGMSVVPVVRVG